MSRIFQSLLENGIKVICEEMADIESVTVGVWLKLGSRHESEDNSGISHFIEHLLFKGTKRRNALDIAREIESVGGILNAFTGREFSCFYAKVLGKDIELAIDILSDILMNSSFLEKELVKERNVIVQEISMVNDTPDDLIHDLFLKSIWGNHPMGRSILGDIKSINSICRKDIISYFRRCYHSEAIIITAAGNLEHGKLKRLLDAYFGGVQKKPFTINPSPPEARQVIVMEERELEQIHLCMGLPVSPQTHRNRYKLYLLNAILGGGMSSRLFQEIREKRGLAYSVYSYLNLYSDAGVLVVYAGTSSDKFVSVVKKIIREFTRIPDSIAAGDLKVAREQVIGNMIIGLESSDNRMMKFAKDEVYFKRSISIDEIIREINSVALSSIRSVARSFLSPERLTLVAIGKVDDKKNFQFGSKITQLKLRGT